MQENNKLEPQATDKHGLLTAPIPETLRKMTVPMTMGMIAILMFNLVDTFFISLLGTQALAAISYTFPVTFAVNCITMGIGMGLSTNIGRLLGQGHAPQAARFTTHGLLLAVLLVAITSSIGFTTIAPLFRFLGASDDLIPLIEQYMQVWYLTIPLLCGSFYVLIKREKLLAQPQWALLKQDWQQTLKIGTPAALSNAMNPLSGAILMMLLSNHGTAAVAAYGAAQRIESILILVLMSLTSALTPFMAQNLGAKQPQRAFSGLFISMRFAVVFQGFIFLMMVPLSIPLAALFSQEDAVKNLLWHYLLVVPFSYGFQGIVMMLVSGLNAMHKPLRAFQWSFMRLFIFTLPSAWIGSQIYSI
ncbi:MATE family efflux transporter, partial [Vibrio alginolyticus]